MSFVLHFCVSLFRPRGSFLLSDRRFRQDIRADFVLQVERQHVVRVVVSNTYLRAPAVDLTKVWRYCRKAYTWGAV